MGWLWSSGSQPKGSSAQAADSLEVEKHGATPSPAPPSEPTYVDPEIAKFMAQIQSEFGDGSSSSNSNNNNATDPDSKNPRTGPSSPSSSWWPSKSSTTTPTQSAHPSSSSSSASDPEPPTQLDPLSESLLPTTMSCRQAFDHAFHCNSLGGQWTAVYRGGAVRSCSEQWDDFWFCMRARAYSPPIREAAIRDHYRRRELRRYGPGQPSSTDVWEPRAERLPPDVAVFRPDPGMRGALAVPDDEWRRAEIERRREIQRVLREEEQEREGARGHTDRDG